jgi:hypothetical protein
MIAVHLAITATFQPGTAKMRQRPDIAQKERAHRTAAGPPFSRESGF